MKYGLWTAQILLALVFLFAGGMKLVMSDQALTEGFPFPALFIRFIGISEVIGAIGLILPGLLKIHPELTAWAAAALTVIMIGAVVTSVMTMGVMVALIPLVIALMSAFVAYGRWPSGAAMATREDAHERELARTS